MGKKLSAFFFICALLLAIGCSSKPGGGGDGPGGGGGGPRPAQGARKCPHCGKIFDEETGEEISPEENQRRLLEEATQNPNQQVAPNHGDSNALGTNRSESGNSLTPPGNPDGTVQENADGTVDPAEAAPTLPPSTEGPAQPQGTPSSPQNPSTKQTTGQAQDASTEKNFFLTDANISSTSAEKRSISLRKADDPFTVRGILSRVDDKIVKVTTAEGESFLIPLGALQDEASRTKVTSLIGKPVAIAGHVGYLPDQARIAGNNPRTNYDDEKAKLAKSGEYVVTKSLSIDLVP